MVFHFLLPVITSGFCCSSQTAELQWSMSCSCMNWGHNKSTLASYCWVIPGPISWRLQGAFCSVTVLKCLHYPQPLILFWASQQEHFSFTEKMKAHGEASSSLFFSVSNFPCVFIIPFSSSGFEGSSVWLLKFLSPLLSFFKTIPLITHLLNICSAYLS